MAPGEKLQAGALTRGRRERRGGPGPVGRGGRGVRAFRWGVRGGEGWAKNLNYKDWPSRGPPLLLSHQGSCMVRFMALKRTR